MKQATFIVLLFLFFGLTTNLNAQTDKQQSAEEKEKQELREKFQKGMQARKMEQRAKSQSIAVQTNKYNNREAEILAKLNTGEIPTDFPIYKNEYSNEQYTILMNKWYTANPALINKESANEQK
ncbi:MAG TPA: hypothetical protein VNZ49_10625 [Bacteroidia bacterium]|jgi:hypothetical protein|nr:hypothetical protein [Bacteroidia bacterium]